MAAGFQTGNNYTGGFLGAQSGLVMDTLYDTSTVFEGTRRTPALPGPVITIFAPLAEIDYGKSVSARDNLIAVLSDNYIHIYDSHSNGANLINSFASSSSVAYSIEIVKGRIWVFYVSSVVIYKVDGTVVKTITLPSAVYLTDVADGLVGVGAAAANSNLGAIWLYDFDGNLVNTITTDGSYTNYGFGGFAIGNNRVAARYYDALGQGVRVTDYAGNEITMLRPTSSSSGFGGASSTDNSIAIGNGVIAVGASNDERLHGGGGYIWVYDLNGNLVFNAGVSATSTRGGTGTVMGVGAGYVFATEPDFTTGACWCWVANPYGLFNDGSPLSGRAGFFGSYTSSFFGRSMAVDDSAGVVIVGGENGNGNGYVRIHKVAKPTESAKHALDIFR